MKLTLNGALLARLSIGNKSGTFDCGVVLLPPGESRLQLSPWPRLSSLVAETIGPFPSRWNPSS